MQKELRVAAYAVCVRDGRVLLARWVNRRDGGEKRWTLPGGGMEHGEDPYDTAVREVEEETGYTVTPALLGVHSRLRQSPRGPGGTGVFQGLRIVYEGRITGGELRSETAGSTDLGRLAPAGRGAGARPGGPGRRGPRPVARAAHRRKGHAVPSVPRKMNSP